MEDIVETVSYILAPLFFWKGCWEELFANNFQFKNLNLTYDFNVRLEPLLDVTINFILYAYSRN